MGMCRRMGSHFHDWIDYNGVAFSTELLELGRTFSYFLGPFVKIESDQIGIAKITYLPKID